MNASLRAPTSLRTREPLTDDQLFRIAPSIFAEHPHESRSEWYGYIPTIEVLNGLRKEGFEPFFVAQSRTRVEGKQEYTKHMLRLRRDISGLSVEDDFPEVVLVNSHDGTCSYRMMTGIFRLVCGNGLIIARETIEDIRVRHDRKDIAGQVIDAAYQVVDGFDQVAGSIEDMRSMPLSLPERLAFAEGALHLKYGDEPPVTPQQVLKPHRASDNDPNLWATFNTAQENLVKGGLKGQSASGRRTTTRPVQSIDGDVRLNKALWILADRMMQLKQTN